jgi:hypothetical protein
MNKKDLIRLAAESVQGGKMTTGKWLGLVAMALVALLAFIAYRLILVDLITHLD